MHLFAAPVPAGKKALEHETAYRLLAYAVQEVYGGKARLCVKNSARESVEYIYELSQKLLQRTENVDISERLFQMDSVETVDLVSQNDEITS